MRDIWNTGKIIINTKESNLTKGTSGIVSLPKKADANAIRQIFTRAWKYSKIGKSMKQVKNFMSRDKIAEELKEMSGNTHEESPGHLEYPEKMLQNNRRN